MPALQSPVDEWFRDLTKRMRSEIKNGAAPKAERLTIREFLARFGHARRGHNVVGTIRKKLEDHGLRTLPDFEFQYVDSTIAIELDEDIDAMAEDSQSMDPAVRIGILAAAHNPPVSVAPNHMPTQGNNTHADGGLFTAGARFALRPRRAWPSSISSRAGTTENIVTQPWATSAPTSSNGLRRRARHVPREPPIITTEPSGLGAVRIDDLEAHSGLHELHYPSVLGKTSRPSAIAHLSAGDEIPNVSTRPE